MPGFTRGRNLTSSACTRRTPPSCSSPTSSVPAANLLGEEGGGFVALMQNLPRERIAIGVTALAGAEQVFADTLAYSQQRQRVRPAGGQASSTTGSSSPRWRPSSRWRGRSPTAPSPSTVARAAEQRREAAMVKWWDTELCNRVVDRCLQLHGGYGYMREYAVGRAFADSRVQTIFGGTTEIMKEIIAGAWGLSLAAWGEPRRRGA